MENVIELAALFFVYGSIHYVNLGLDPSAAVFPRAAGSSLLRNAMCVECAWLLWGIASFVKWFRSLSDIPLVWRPLFMMATRNSRDHIVKTWLVTNLGSSIFLFTWRAFPSSKDALQVNETLVLVIEMAVFAFWSFSVFRHYYMGTLQDYSSEVVKDRRRFSVLKKGLVAKGTYATKSLFLARQRIVSIAAELARTITEFVYSIKPASASLIRRSRARIGPWGDRFWRR